MRFYDTDSEPAGTQFTKYINSYPWVTEDIPELTSYETTDDTDVTEFLEILNTQRLELLENHRYHNKLIEFVGGFDRWQNLNTVSLIKLRYFIRYGGPIFPNTNSVENFNYDLVCAAVEDKLQNMDIIFVQEHEKPKYRFEDESPCSDANELELIKQLEAIDIDALVDEAGFDDPTDRTDFDHW